MAQYNLEKVGSLETVKHIIQILHLLPTPLPASRELMLRAVEGIPDFELRASRELETRHVPLEDGWPARGLELRPLRVRFGVLQSDFRDGLAKFFNRNPDGVPEHANLAPGLEVRVEEEYVWVLSVVVVVIVDHLSNFEDPTSPFHFLCVE